MSLADLGIDELTLGISLLRFKLGEVGGHPLPLEPRHLNESGRAVVEKLADEVGETFTMLGPDFHLTPEGRAGMRLLAESLQREIDRRERFFSGDWLGYDKGEEYRYRIGYRAERMGALWNGWATPLVTRAVLARMIETQDALFNDPESGFSHDVEATLSLDGDTLIMRQPSPNLPVDPDDDTEDVHRLDPDAEGFYDLGVLGWTWTEVRPSECDDVAR